MILWVFSGLNDSMKSSPVGLQSRSGGCQHLWCDSPDKWETFQVDSTGWVEYRSNNNNKNGYRWKEKNPSSKSTVFCQEDRPDFRISSALSSQRKIIDKKPMKSSLCRSPEQWLSPTHATELYFMAMAVSEQYQQWRSCPESSSALSLHCKSKGGWSQQLALPIVTWDPDTLLGGDSWCTTTPD